ncbi:unnamed protein product [Cylicocyclus nassatus]|uniref:Uncharacterized protein n=1 Tax=Cylicocyclus nassatus TaxID=53992 RepID=A0AA36GK54_CYLNA|nr:unnamed protein product [Cylicocyclus nassatus]
MPRIRSFMNVLFLFAFLPTVTVIADTESDSAVAEPPARVGNSATGPDTAVDAREPAANEDAGDATADDGGPGEEGAELEEDEENGQGTDEDYSPDYSSYGVAYYFSGNDDLTQRVLENLMPKLQRKVFLQPEPFYVDVVRVSTNGSGSGNYIYTAKGAIKREGTIAADATILTCNFDPMYVRLFSIMK